METNYSKLLTKFTSILRIVGISLLVTSPARADIPPLSPNNQSPGQIVPVTTSTTTPSTNSPQVGKTHSQSLIEFLQSSGSFKMLLKAIQAADLTDKLIGSEPFTLFAPTDIAFSKLNKKGLQDLLRPENKEVLVNILKYHVVKGKIRAEDLKSSSLASTQGEPIKITVNPDSQTITVDDAKITEPNIEFSNGVIHQIDNVILPNI